MNMAMTDAPITSKGSSASMPFASSAIASASKKPGAYFFRVCIWVFFLSFQHTGRQRKICLTTGSSPIIYEDPRLVKYPHSFIGMCPRYFIAKTYPQDRKLISYPYALSIALRSSRWYDHIMILHKCQWSRTSMDRETVLKHIRSETNGFIDHNGIRVVDVDEDRAGSRYARPSKPSCSL